MTLSELGTTLQTEREKRGLTLQDVAERLRINIHVLRALEAGDASALPHKAYAKGFIRSYATLLGLATDEIEACVASLSGASPSVPQPIATPVSMGDESKGESVTVPTGKMLACAIVLLALAGGGYAVSHFGLLDLVPSAEQVRTAIPLLADAGKSDAESARKQEKKAQPSPADSKSAAPTPKTEGKQAAPEKAASSAPNKSMAGPVAGQNAAGQNAGGQNAGQPAAPRNAAGQKSPAPAASTASTAQSASAASPEQPASLPRHNKIIVTATEDCWIHSNADKTNTRQFTLRKGDTFALTFARSLEVKLGNAAGVRIRYNGNELPPAGKRGETRTLVFPLAEQQ